MPRWLAQLPLCDTSMHWASVVKDGGKRTNGTNVLARRQSNHALVIRCPQLPCRCSGVQQVVATGFLGPKVNVMGLSS